MEPSNDAKMNNNNTTDTDANVIQSDPLPTQSNHNQTATVPPTNTETTQNTQIPQTTEHAEQTEPKKATPPIIPASNTQIMPNPMTMAGMNGMNPLMASMSTIPGLNPSTMLPMPGMPGFPPFMFGTPPMLPFMPNPAVNPLANTHKTKTGKRCGDWQAYITEKGKTYYFNVVSKVNTWDRPNEWRQDNSTQSIKNTQTQIPAQNANAIDPKKKEYLGTKATKQLAVIRDNVAKRSFGNKCKAKYKDRSERVAAFRALLVDKQIDPAWNWKKVLHKIVNDARYNALTKLDDKKNELVLWQQDEKKRIKEEERAKRHKLKGGFFALLDENMEKIVRKEYRKAKHYLESDGRYAGIVKKHRREEWFDEWQVDAYKSYKKKRKKEKENALKEFTARLRDSGSVALGVSYTDIRPQLDFLDAAFMADLSERHQNKIYDEIYNDLKEKEKQEKKLKMKAERNNFNALLDELIGQRLLHCKCKYEDKKVTALLCNDERYQTIKNGAQSHRMCAIFSEKMDSLKYALSKDKKLFKSFVKLHENELSIEASDDLQSVLPKFKAIMHGKEGEILNVSMDHIELLLLEYISKRQRVHNKEKEVDHNLINVNRRNSQEKKERKDIKFNIKCNGNSGKKRTCSAVMEQEGHNEEPQRKRQKIDKCEYVEVTIHDPNENVAKGEAEELEEGELSDGDNDKKDDGQIMEEKVGAMDAGLSGDSERSRSDSECSYDSGGDGRGRKGKRRSKKAGGKKSHHRNHHSRHRKHRSYKVKEKRDESGVGGTSIGLLYGMTSDFDEDDLYYRGDVKRGHDDDDGHMHADGEEAHNIKRRRNHRGHSHRSGGGGHWRNSNNNRSRRGHGHYSHHDLDYNYNQLDENEINADSYNLDNHQMARWNTGH